MRDEKAIAFFEQVKSKTEQGRIPWEPTAVESDYAAAIGGEFTVTIRRVDHSNGLSSFGLILRDASSRVVVSVWEDMDGVDARQLSELFDLVTRQASRVHEKLDRVLSVLERL